jgi:hypothetical protein
MKLEDIKKLELNSCYTAQEISDIYKQILFSYSLKQLGELLSNTSLPSFIHSIIAAYTLDAAHGRSSMYQYMVNNIYREPIKQNHLSIIIGNLKIKPVTLKEIMQITGQDKASCLSLVQQIAQTNTLIETRPEEYILIEGSNK